MPLQFVNIKDSTVTFANEEKDPAKKTEADLATITFESMMDKFKIATLEQNAAVLTFEIMQLKMGGN